MQVHIPAAAERRQYALYECPDLNPNPQVWQIISSTIVAGTGGGMDLTTSLELLLPLNHYRVGYFVPP